MRSAKISLIAGVIVLTGCGNLLPPAGVEGYEYREQVMVGDATYRLAFHWPRSSLPVTVFVEPDLVLESSLAKALATWEGAFMYGEVRFGMVSDSNRADIIVRNENPIKPSQGISLGSAGTLCFGSTDFDADPVAGTLTLPFRVRLSSLNPPENPAVRECYDATMLHEIGHAIGIFEHSPNGDDVMNPTPTRTTLSARDRATAVAAYHLPANLVPVRD